MFTVQSLIRPNSSIETTLENPFPVEEHYELDQFTKTNILVCYLDF